MNNAKSGEITVVEPSAIAEITRGEVDMQIATAKRYPRDLERFKKNVATIVLSDKETAESCNYTLKRGDTLIQGPSIRLAEIAIREFGNARAGARLIDIGEKAVRVQALAWDLESNVQITKEITRRITKTNGQRYNDDMINVTANAGMSIALRNAIFGILPWSLIKETYIKARDIAGGSEGDVEKNFKAALAWLKKKKVSKKDILRKLDVSSDKDITREHIVILKGMAQSIKDGEQTAVELFAATDDEPSEDDATDFADESNDETSDDDQGEISEEEGSGY